MYDLMVIGDDISSYIAAAAASHYGLNTVHIAEHDVKKQSLFNDFTFNIDPTPMTGFGINQTGKSLLDELKISFPEEEATLLNPAYQVILPEHRIDCFHDKDSLVSDVIREFPQMSSAINVFYDAVVKNSNIMINWIDKHPFIKIKGMKNTLGYFELIPHLIKFKLNHKRFKRVLFSNPSFRKVFEAQLALLSCATNGFDSFTSHYQYSAPLRGVYHFRHGKNALTKALVEKFELHSGKYLSNIQLLSVKKSKSIDAEIADSDGVLSQISAEYLIISNKSEGMNSLFKGKKKIKTNKWTRHTKNSHYPFTLQFIILEKCLPEKMARHVAMISDVNKDIFDDNLIILEANKPATEKKAFRGQKLLTATVFLPAEEQIWSKEKLTQTSQSVMKRIEYFLPFLQENTEFYNLDKSIDISIKYRNIVNAKYQVKKSFISGFGAKNNKTPFKNIHLTGASLMTDTGFEGEIISGMHAVYNILNKRK